MLESIRRQAENAIQRGEDVAKQDLETFQKSIETRPLAIEDYEAITRLQEKCFPGMQPWERGNFRSLIEIFPEGQICVEYDGRIIGSASSLLVDLDEFSVEHTWSDITGGGNIETHDPEGDTLYGIEVMVDPEFQGMKIGRRLYDERKNIARRLDLKRIVVGGRVPNYHKCADELSIHEYVEQVMAKRLYDPVLTFQISNGFVLKRILPDYFETDRESEGYAMLLEWVNLNYTPNPATRSRTTFPVRICTVQYRMRKIESFEDFQNQCDYFVDVASGYKSDFVVFPEIITLQLLSFLPQERPGLSVRKLAGFTDRYIESFQQMAIRYAINIVAGSHYTEENDKIYNVAYLFRRDGSIERQAKIHITPNERHWWGVQPGDDLNVFDTDKGKIAIAVCYDIEFPELGRIATEKGARIIFVPFATDNRQAYLRVRYCALARAVENQIFVVTSGCVGNLPSVENMDINYARSGIFTPLDFPFARDGIAGECQANIETAVIADVDLEVLRRARHGGTVRNWNDRRTDLYSIRVQEKAE
ncbi:MAG TPA: GNAT family N-acetyltransferase [Candidatus Eisenbacteria bacterium]|uniref:GNAT family N-acetyltransferase n=1 Tax=Eiseniibacteriota bacterium TaxID=2212470 RepID=A0A7V2AWI5_UNCEI|nr:GNAT family N-acetyltransferase [Candidatus Eisenbacteria bacterium]